MLDTDRERCAGLACAPGTVFATVYRFLQDVEADHALALEALFYSVRNIPATVNDAGVAMTKLAWWARECGTDQAASSQHPVVRAVYRSGAWRRLQSSAWKTYLGALSRAVEAGPESDDEFQARLSDTGGMEALIMVGLPTDHELAESVVAVGVAGRLLTLIEGLVDAPSTTAHLPSDWRRRYAMETGRGVDNEHLGPLTGALRQMALGYLSLTADDWWQSLHRDNGAAAHLVLRMAVERHRLERRGGQQVNAVHSGRKPSFGEVFVAWRQARRLTAGRPG